MFLHLKIDLDTYKVVNITYSGQPKYSPSPVGERELLMFLLSDPRIKTKSCLAKALGVNRKTVQRYFNNEKAVMSLNLYKKLLDLKHRMDVLPKTVKKLISNE